MEDFCKKTGITAVLSFLSLKSGLQKESLIILVVAMVLDYISGIIAGAVTRQLDSKKGFEGILKKCGYILILCVTVLADVLLANFGQQLGMEFKTSCTFSMLVVTWMTLNELLSIVENISRTGIPLPAFITRTLKAFQKKTEEIDKTKK